MTMITVMVMGAAEAIIKFDGGREVESFAIR
jgi:hypothetical protein